MEVFAPAETVIKKAIWFEKRTSGLSKIMRYYGLWGNTFAFQPFILLITQFERKFNPLIKHMLP